MHVCKSLFSPTQGGTRKEKQGQSVEKLKLKASLTGEWEGMLFNLRVLPLSGDKSGGVRKVHHDILCDMAEKFFSTLLRSTSY